MIKNDSINLIINSLILLIAAFVVAYIPFQLLSFGLAKVLNMPVAFEYYKVKFTAPDASPLWTNATIVALYGVPPFFSLGLANLARLYHKSAKRNKGNLKLFLVWLSLVCDNMFWGAMLAGVITSSGFILFFNWIYVPKIIQIIIIIFGTFLYSSLGTFLKVSFLQTAPLRTDIDVENQIFYTIKIIFIPLVLGVLLLSIFSFPNNSFYEIILRFTIFIPLYKTLKYRKSESIKLAKNSQTFSPEWIVLGLIVLYLVGFRLLTKFNIL